jgi:hypothetical protein
MENVLKLLVWKAEEKDHLENLCINGRIILEWILKNLAGAHVLNKSGSG